MLPPLSPMATLRWQLVARVLDELTPRNVLEIGCGQGGFGARIAARPDVSYVGVEPDEKSWTVAAERITPLGGDVRLGTSDLVGEHERFDLVCAFEVLEHLEHDTAAATDWVRHLRPGGSLLVSVPAWPERFSPMDTLVGHFRRYTPDALEDVLRAAGVTQPNVRLYGWPLGFALESVRARIAARRPSTGAMEERSATSGRLLQPPRIAGAAVALGAAPFGQLQRLRPNRGTGLVAHGVVS
jgi:SAM-dependent methyltransferase